MSDVRALVAKEIASIFDERDVECLKCRRQHKAWIKKSLGSPLVVMAWCPFCADYTLHRLLGVVSVPSVVSSQQQVVMSRQPRKIYRLREGYYVSRLLNNNSVRLPLRIVERMGYPLAVSIVWDDDLRAAVLRPATPEELEVIQVANQRER